jgi:hypothetical protein
VSGEGIIGALIGAVGGGGGWAVLSRVFGPERRRLDAETEVKVGSYHVQLIGALENENRQLRGRVDDLEAWRTRIELGDGPGEFS